MAFSFEPTRVPCARGTERSAHPEAPARVAAQRSARGIDAGSARLAGRVQAGLIGVRRLGVAFTGGDDARVLAMLAARALGADKVVALVEGHEPRAALGIDLALSFELATVVVPSLAAPIPARLTRRAGIDTIAYPETADVEQASTRLMLLGSEHCAARYPLAEAGLCGVDVVALMRELELPPGLPDIEDDTGA